MCAIKMRPPCEVAARPREFLRSLFLGRIDRDALIGAAASDSTQLLHDEKSMHRCQPLPRPFAIAKTMLETLQKAR